MYNHKYYEHESTNAWVRFDEQKSYDIGVYSILCMLDTIGRSLASIADSLEKITNTDGPKGIDLDIGLSEGDEL